MRSALGSRKVISRLALPRRRLSEAKTRECHCIVLQFDEFRGCVLGRARQAIARRRKNQDQRDADAQAAESGRRESR